jgi:hypothetical protein
MKDELVKHPNHYQIGKTGIEVKDVIKGVLEEEEKIEPITPWQGYILGNIIKYILRANKKGGTQDYEKAIEYLNWMVEDKRVEIFDDQNPITDPFKLDEINESNLDSLINDWNLESINEKICEVEEKDSGYVKVKFKIPNNDLFCFASKLMSSYESNKNVVFKYFFKDAYEYRRFKKIDWPAYIGEGYQHNSYLYWMTLHLNKKCVNYTVRKNGEILNNYSEIVEALMSYEDIFVTIKCRTCKINGFGYKDAAYITDVDIIG